MSRRLKPVKDLSVLILAPRKHDRQLWAELLKNCGINFPQSMSGIEQAATAVASGQADVVFVDDSYGAEGIANVLIPARNVEFAGGRGVCLILCSKKATAQDVINARKLGFASLVILPASTDTVRKHLELAARYIPPTDEELGWSAPKAKEQQESKALPAPKDDLASQAQGNSNGIPVAKTASNGAANTAPSAASKSQAQKPQERSSIQNAPHDGKAGTTAAAANQPTPDNKAPDTVRGSRKSPEPDQDMPRLKTPGRSGSSAEEEVVFL